MFSCTKVWIVISSIQPWQLGRVGQPAVDQQVGDLEVGRVLAELLDRVAAVLEDARVAVDVGDRAAARGGVHERRVVGHQPEFVGVDLDLAQLGRAHGAVLDRQLVGLAGAAVGDREHLAARAAVRLRRRCCPPGSRCSWASPSALGCSAIRLWGMRRAPPGVAPDARQRRGSHAWRRGASRSTTRTRGGRRAAAGSPCGPRRGGRGGRRRGRWG